MEEKEDNIESEEVKKTELEPEQETEIETETETVTETETETEIETETETEAETADVTEAEDAGEEIVVVVYSGEGSGTVSKRMAELGLVEDASEFDKFLMKNGYDKRISVGNYVMQKGMSWDEMGKVLCSKAK